MFIYIYIYIYIKPTFFYFEVNAKHIHITSSKHSNHIHIFAHQSLSMTSPKEFPVPPICFQIIYFLSRQFQKRIPSIKADVVFEGETILTDLPSLKVHKCCLITVKDFTNACVRTGYFHHKEIECMSDQIK